MVGTSGWTRRELGLALPALMTPPGPVPPEHQALYAALQAKLEAFRPGTPPAGATTRFGAELYLANSNRGEALLDPQALNEVKACLNRFQQLGMQGVTLSVHEAPLARSSRASEYVAFYRAVAAEARARGLLLVIESQSSFGVDYTSVSFETYRQARRSALQTIITELRPDYLVIASEPSTELKLTGYLELATVGGFALFLTYLLNGLARGTTLVGAGTGTWQDVAYMQAFAQLDLDFLGMHVYPIVFVPERGDLLERIVDFSAIAQQRRKRLLIGECWLHKAGASELIQGEPATEVFQRDPFSFWQPLDQLFLQKVADVARVQRMDYVSAYWTQYFFAYLEYNVVNKSLTWQALFGVIDRLARENMRVGTITNTARYYQQLIAG